MLKTGKFEYRNEILSILKNQGVRGLYRGIWAHGWRDVPRWAICFGSYEQIKLWNL